MEGHCSGRRAMKAKCLSRLERKCDNSPRMELVALLISLLLTAFVLVALGQLFSIKDSLKRLVQIAEESRPASTQLDPLAGAQSLSELSDEALLAKWKETKDAGIAEHLRRRGYYME